MAAHHADFEDDDADVSLAQLSTVMEAEVESDGTFPSPTGDAATEPGTAGDGARATSAALNLSAASDDSWDNVAVDDAARRSPARVTARFHVARRLDMSGDGAVNDAAAGGGPAPPSQPSTAPEPAPADPQPQWVAMGSRDTAGPSPAAHSVPSPAMAGHAQQQLPQPQPQQQQPWLSAAASVGVQPQPHHLVAAAARAAAAVHQAWLSASDQRVLAAEASHDASGASQWQQPRGGDGRASEGSFDDDADVVGDVGGGEVPVRPSPAYMKRQRRAKKARAAKGRRGQPVRARASPRLAPGALLGTTTPAKAAHTPATRRSSGRTPQSDPRGDSRRRRRRSAPPGGNSRHGAQRGHGGRRGPQHKRRPEWDSDLHDLSKYKLSPKELAARHRKFVSPNNVLRNMDVNSAMMRRQQQFREALKRGDVPEIRPADKRQERLQLVARAKEYAEAVRAGVTQAGDDDSTPAAMQQPTALPDVAAPASTPASVRFAADGAPTQAPTRSPASFTPAKRPARAKRSPSEAPGAGPSAAPASSAAAAMDARLTAALEAAARDDGDGNSDSDSDSSAEGDDARLGAPGAVDEDSEAEEAHGAAVSPMPVTGSTTATQSPVPTTTSPSVLAARLRAAAMTPNTAERARESTILSLTQRLAESEALLVKERAAREALQVHVQRLESQLRVLRSGISDEEWQARVSQQEAEAAADFAAAQSWAVHGRAGASGPAPTSPSDVFVRGEGRPAQPQALQPRHQQQAPPADAEQVQKPRQGEAASAADERRGAGEIVYTNPQGASPGTVTAGRAGTASPRKPGLRGEQPLAPSSASPALGPPRRVAKGVIHWFSSPKPGSGTASTAAKPRPGVQGVSPAGAATAPLTARTWHDDDGVVVRVSPAARAAAGNDEALPRRAPLSKAPGASRRAVWRHNMQPTPVAVVREPPRAASANPMSPPTAAGRAPEPVPRGSAGLSRALAAQHRHYAAMDARLGSSAGGDDAASVASDSLEHPAPAARNRRDAYARFANGEYDGVADDVRASGDGRGHAHITFAGAYTYTYDGPVENDEDGDGPMPEPVSPVPASLPRVPDVHVSYVQPRKSGAQPWRMMGSRPPVSAV